MNEIPIHRIPMLARGLGGLRLALNYASFVISGILFSPWMLRGKKFDVIFVYGNSPILQAIPAIFLGWIKRHPVVLWVQDLWPESLSCYWIYQEQISPQIGCLYCPVYLSSCRSTARAIGGIY